MEAMGILAGGKGTRLFGPRGGTKALVKVGDRPLIDFVLSEAARAGIVRLAIAAREDDHELTEFLANDTRFDDVTFIATNGVSTLDGVLALNRTLGSEDHLLSTCDVISPPGALRRLIEEGRKLARSGCLVLFLASDYVHDDAPIWIHTTDSGAISAYGKRIRPSRLVFGHIRWVSRHLQDVLRELDTSSVTTDTELMALLVREQPERLWALRDGSIIDVDSPSDIEIAKELLISRPFQGA